MKTQVFEGKELPVVTIRHHFISMFPDHTCGVVRVTKNFYVLRLSERSTRKFERNPKWEISFEIGDGFSKSYIPKEDVDELEQFVNGGLWDSGWKPVKEKKNGQ